MLVKIFGAIDLIIGLFLIIGTEIKLPYQLLIFLGIILLIKSMMGLLKDFASWIDFICGINFILLIFFPVPSVIIVILGILLMQKGIFSFL